jgi:hypothetical protein
LTLDPASFNNSLSKNAPKEAHIQLDEDHHRFMKLNKGKLIENAAIFEGGGDQLCLT